MCLQQMIIKLYFFVCFGKVTKSAQDLQWSFCSRLLRSGGSNNIRAYLFFIYELPLAKSVDVQVYSEITSILTRQNVNTQGEAQSFPNHQKFEFLIEIRQKIINVTILCKKLRLSKKTKGFVYMFCKEKGGTG